MTRHAATCAIACVLAALLGACASREPSPDSYAFGIFGDAPYSEAEVGPFLAAIDAMNAEPLAFVVHVGDIKAGGDSPCTDALYLERKAQFDRIAHPFFFIPGDNEWVDCRRRSNGGMDPIERLRRVRQVFHGSDPSGKQRFAALGRQPGYPENGRWVHGGVVFATVNAQGSNDNFGFDAANDAEHAARLAANLAWMREAVEVARQGEARGLAIMMQANPFLPSKGNVYEPYLAAFREAAAQLRRPVLLINGDTHWQRVDHPFVGPDGRALPDLTRLETYGSPWVGWVKVIVDPNDPGLFRFEPHPQ